MKKGVVVLGCVLLLLFAGTVTAQEQFITIHWAQWAPADYLQKLSEGFTTNWTISTATFMQIVTYLHFQLRQNTSYYAFEISFYFLPPFDLFA